jgi:hypothetical protein
VEGGGVFVVGGAGYAHFLVADARAAREALGAVGVEVLADREVLVQVLDQAEPGQLGRIARRMAEAGVNIEVQYSDHQNRLILVVDDSERGRQVSRAWTAEPGDRRDGPGGDAPQGRGAGTSRPGTGSDTARVARR